MIKDMIRDREKAIDLFTKALQTATDEIEIKEIELRLHKAEIEINDLITLL